MLSEPTTIVLTHNGPPPLKRADNREAGCCVSKIWNRFNRIYLQDYKHLIYKQRQTNDNKNIRPFQGRGTSRKAGGGFF